MKKSLFDLSGRTTFVTGGRSGLERNNAVYSHKIENCQESNLNRMVKASLADSGNLVNNILRL